MTTTATTKSLDMMNVRELKAEAARQQIEGRSKMTPEELKAAITLAAVNGVDAAKAEAQDQAKAEAQAASDDTEQEAAKPVVHVLGSKDDTAEKAPAKKAAPVKKAPAVATTVMEMSREQKRAVAAILIGVAGELVKNTDWVGADGDLEGVTAKAAGELIGSWLSYCPGKTWHDALGARPRG